MTPSFPTVEAHYSFEELFLPSDQLLAHHLTWQEEVDPEDGEDDFHFPCNPITSESSLGPHWSLQDLVDITVTKGQSKFDNPDGVNATFVAVRSQLQIRDLVYLLNPPIYTAPSTNSTFNFDRYILRLCTCSLLTEW